MKLSRSIRSAMLIVMATSCADNTDGAESQASGVGGASASGEAIGQSAEALTAADPYLPRWRVYLAGQDNARSMYPDEVDAQGHIIAVRQADAKGPRKVVHFYLQNHWMTGDKMFENDIAAGKYTSLDLLVINSEILEKHGNLPPAPPEVMRTLSTRVNDGGDYSPFPGFPGSGPGVPGGGPVAGSSHPNGTKPSGNSGGTNGSNGGHPGGRGGNSAPIGPSRNRREEARRNGVRPGDPYADGSGYPTIYPGIPGLDPLGEGASLFKCEGAVYHGDKTACPDFRGSSIAGKWTDKLSRWTKEHWSKLKGKLTPTKEEYEFLCKLFASGAGAATCTIALGGCSAATEVTLGGVVFECAVLLQRFCVANSVPTVFLFDQCPKIADNAYGK